MNGKLVIIGGPTATGKSDLAVDMASRFPFEIVNFDSVQVYRYMDIGTAKPPREIREKIPHHLYDIRNPDEEFSASQFVQEAETVIKDIWNRGRIPLFVGGTGFYARSLLYGLDELPSSESLRKELRERVSKEGLEKLWEELEERDPEYASSISPRDTYRVIRALEVVLLTGKTYTEQRKRWRERVPRFEFLFFVTIRDRAEIYRRIDERAEKMIRGGLIEEVKELLSMGYSPELKPLKSHGYKHVIQYLRGECSLEEALEDMKKETRNYAKRQITWFKREEALWVCPEEKEKIVKILESFLV